MRSRSGFWAKALKACATACVLMLIATTIFLLVSKAPDREAMMIAGSVLLGLAIMLVVVIYSVNNLGRRILEFKDEVLDDELLVHHRQLIQIKLSGWQQALCILLIIGLALLVLSMVIALVYVLNYFDSVNFSLFELDTERQVAFAGMILLIVLCNGSIVFVIQALRMKGFERGD